MRFGTLMRRKSGTAMWRALTLSVGGLGAWLPGTGEAARGEEGRGGAGERVFSCEAVMSAPVADVWKMWTTVEGIKSFGVGGAHVELRAGGAYEWYFMPDAPPGQRGAEGCTVLAYLPEKMLAFTWNAPPAIPTLREAGAKSNVVVMLEELPGGRTRVRLHQLGYGTGEDWDKYYAYFEKAWPTVLSWMKKKWDEEEGAAGAAAAKGMAALEPLIGTWTTSGDWDGSEGGIRVVYGWGLNRRSVHVQSYRTSQGVEAQAYETVVTWHPRDRQYVFRSVSADGGLFDGVAAWMGDTLHWQWDGFSGDRVHTFRQAVRPVGSDAYEWTVQARTADGWKTIKEAKLVRQREE